MGQRAIKGVLARNSWDFYEYSNGWAFTSATWTVAGTCALLINNGAAPGNMDVYRAELYAASAIKFYWFACPISGAIPASIGAPDVTQSCETNQPTPLGLVGSYTAPWFTVDNLIRYRVDGPTSDMVEVQSGGPFVTLAPNWCLGVRQDGSPITSVIVAVNFWYQVLLDNVSQVR
jgi:hypothetical protein